ncbi:hypothetical protein CLOSTHATH_06532 [Hungatella hathewayi DSM 13479]|uniref:Uncharacterized protein n=1 Tax=Hungatella hathewayi DSM 13479 TaxID=566550 RepID=D3ASC4_9FIRM|nr:hypothetical protein CLOSTHATH_06532 [Hungatella hathewayi DSM 13479]
MCNITKLSSLFLSLFSLPDRPLSEHGCFSGEYFSIILII